ncbi:MAG: glycosyltransferase family A protein [bacterium]
MKYVIITAARDEESNIERTIQSVLAQTVQPSEWVIVNDGSRDKTGDIAERYAAQFQWIRALHRIDRGVRKSGGGVIETFTDGFFALTVKDWDFIVKLDGDLSFGPHYFEQCLLEFESDTKLGIGGGTVCLMTNSGEQVESRTDPRFHVRGATKIYRRACYEAIGGLLVATGWDTLDEVKANMLGWRTRTFPGPRLVHHRQTGAADGSWNDSMKNGLANYVTGYHPLFMACKCIRRMLRKPWSPSGIALWLGFMKGYLNHIPQVDDPAMIRYLRNQQWRALTLRPSLWN